MRRPASGNWQIVLALALLLAAPGAFGVECPLNNNPLCSAATNLGAISGDSGSQAISRAGVGEAFFLVQLKETSAFSRALTARVVLNVPPGADYDLIVRCFSCASTAMRTSNAASGVAELVNVSRPDTFGDQSFVIAIEIRYRSGSSCAQWALAVTGNTGASAAPLACQ